MLPGVASHHTCKHCSVRWFCHKFRHNFFCEIVRIKMYGANDMVFVSSFECSYCDKQFTGNNFLRRPLKQKHPGSELPVCLPSGRIPQKAASRPAASALFACDICTRSFATQRALKLHKNAMHARVYIRSQAVTKEFST